MFIGVFETTVQRIRKQLFLPVVVALSMICFLPPLARATSPAPQMHEKVQVSGHLVTLADLFDNAGENGYVPLFRAPDPGTSGIISVNRILSAAKKHGVKLVTRPDFMMVTISRSSRVIELKELEDLIRDRLNDSQPAINTDSQLEITLPKNLKPLNFDAKIQGELSLSRLSWSARSERFTAHFRLPGTDPFVIKGRASLMIEVNVAKSAIAKGTVFSRQHARRKLVRSATMRTPGSANIDELIGLSAKRSLSAGNPLRVSDFEAPVLIHKNQLVTILLEVPGLVLRTEGKSLSNAKKGEAVKVLNTQSKRIIHATAKASGLVSVSLAQSFVSGS